MKSILVIGQLGTYVEFLEYTGQDGKGYIAWDTTGKLYAPYNTIRKYANYCNRKLIPFQVRDIARKVLC